MTRAHRDPGDERTDPRPPAIASAPEPEAPGASASGLLTEGAVIAGRYRVVSRLGSGGMGEVFRVLDEELHEQVALKVIRPDRLGDPSIVDRFRREVRVARKITHPNVCRVFDLGEAHGVRFLTMELIAGDTLRALLRRGVPPTERALLLLREIVLGVAAAHEQGVMHRDLKPENVMVRAGDGHAIVLDFGLARGTFVAETSTVPFAGTPAYMSPEQLRGESLGLQSDVFSLGIIAHELLTGRSPFGTGSPAAVASAILRDPPEPLDAPGLRVDVGAALRAVIQRALVKSAGERFASAVELAAALDAAIDGEAPRGPRRADGSPEIAAAGSSEAPTLPAAADSRAADPEPGAVDPESRGGRSDRGARPSARGRSRARWIALVACIVAFGAGLVWWWPRPREDAAIDVDAPPEVVVEPFVNLSGEPAWEPLRESAAETARAGLRTVPTLRVLERAPAPTAPRAVSAWVLSGNIQRVGDRLRLGAQFRAATAEGGSGTAGEPLDVEGDPADPGPALAALRARAVEEARLLVRDAERRRRARAGTDDASARASLLEYHELMGAAVKPAHLELGQKLLDEALARDPDYVPALVERASVRARRALRQRDAGELAGARADAERALRLAPRDPPAWLAECQILSWALGFGEISDAAIDAAVAACEGTVRHDPTSAEAQLTLASLHERRCEDDQAITAAERAVELEPAVAGPSLVLLVGVAIYSDRLAVADRMSQKLVELHDEEARLGERAFSRRAGSRPIRGAHGLRAAVLLRLGHHAAARDELLRALQEASGGLGEAASEAAAIRGLLRLSALGVGDVAPTLVQRLEAIEEEYRRGAERDPQVARRLASAYQLLDREAALPWLDRMMSPESCTAVLERALAYHEAGNDVTASKLLDDCRSNERWAQRCVGWLRGRLARR